MGLIMRFHFKLILVLGATTELGSLAWAEPVLGSPLPTEIVRIDLLQNQSVQKELKFTEAQAQKLKDVFVHHQESIKDVWQTFPPTEAGAKWQEMRKDLAKEAMSLLDAGQQKRFWQIDFQSATSFSWDSNTFLRPDVEKTLQFTDAQKQRLKAIQSETARKNMEIFKSPERNLIQTKTAALRKEDKEQVALVVTDEQRKKWLELTGQPFVVKVENTGADLRTALQKWLRDDFGAAQAQARKTGKPIFALFRCEP
jgi:Spy/CpxP family protein refolding chaperone